MAVKQPLARLYAFQIKFRKITILDVPEEYRSTVMSYLDESDKYRMQLLLDENNTDGSDYNETK